MVAAGLHSYFQQTRRGIMTKGQFRPRLEGDKFIDRVEVSTIPRFKTSGLSGDEWRTGVQLVAYRKGRVVKERFVGNMDYATRLVGMNDWWLNDDESVSEPDMCEDLCDQPGCDQPWTVLYRRVKDGCGRCGAVKAREDDDRWAHYQAFCERHAHRGNSSLDDSDDNYKPVEGAHPSEQVVRTEDESPAMFGGFVTLDEEGKLS
jgi:hypothetical protein